LLGAGAPGVDGWLDRGRAIVRPALLVGAIALNAAVSLVISLPILPADDAGPVVDLKTTSARRSAGPSWHGRSRRSIATFPPER
jgi:hypothetical protein